MRLTFNFSVLPLFLVTTFLLPDTYYVVITADHICIDQRSLQAMFEDLEALYRGLLTNVIQFTAKPSALTSQEYAAWELEEIYGSRGGIHAAYWRSLLGDTPLSPVSRAFSDYHPSFHYSYKQFINAQLSALPPIEHKLFYTLAYGVARRLPSKPLKMARYITSLLGSDFFSLAAAARQLGLPLSTIVITALLLMLHKASGHKRVHLALLCDTRIAPEFSDISGCFINEILCLVNIDAEESLREMALRVASQLGASYDHRIYPLQKVMQDLDVSPDGLGTLSLNYVSTFANAPMPVGERAGHVADGFSALDLDFKLAAFKDGIRVECHYCCGLFQPSTIERLTADLLGFLRHFALNVSMTVGDSIYVRRASSPTAVTNLGITQQGERI